MGIAGRIGNVLQTGPTTRRAARRHGPTPTAVTTSFNPYPHNIAAVKAYVVAHPDERAAVLAREHGGQARVTLVEWLESGG